MVSPATPSRRRRVPPGTGLWGRIRRMNQSARAQFLATQGPAQRHHFRDQPGGPGVFSIDRARRGTRHCEGRHQFLQRQPEAVSTAPAGRGRFTPGNRVRRGASGFGGGNDSRPPAPDIVAGRFDQRLDRRESWSGDTVGDATRTIDAAGGSGWAAVGVAQTQPDIREAEQLLRSANAQIGVAESSFLPQISLTALFGQVSPQLSTFTAGTANAWNLAANAASAFSRRAACRAVPAGQGGARSGQIAIPADRSERDAGSFGCAGIAAEIWRGAGATIPRGGCLPGSGAGRHKERYRNGQSSYYEVLQEQQLLYPAENILVQAKLSQLTAVVQLYRSLGGGWSIQPP